MTSFAGSFSIASASARSDSQSETLRLDRTWIELCNNWGYYWIMG